MQILGGVILLATGQQSLLARGATTARVGLRNANSGEGVGVRRGEVGTTWHDLFEYVHQPIRVRHIEVLHLYMTYSVYVYTRGTHLCLTYGTTSTHVLPYVR
jgi:hypothetical protein